MGGKGYLGTGYNSGAGYLEDFWEYDPVSNTWQQKSDFGGVGRINAAAFSINGKGYVGTGRDSVGNYLKDFWEYTPGCTNCCLIPSGEYTDAISTNSAKVHWNVVATANKYKVRYRVTGTNTWTTLSATTNFKKLASLSPNTQYDWQVKSICNAQGLGTSGWSSTQSFSTNPLRLSSESKITFEVYPNPVSSSATIDFVLNQSATVSFKLFSVDGMEVMTFANEDFTEGSHQFHFNRESLPAGIYLLQLKTGDQVMVKKMIIE